MSLLSGPQIKEEIKKGTIKIRPFDPDNVNPNSVNLCLGQHLLVYQRPNWLMRQWLALKGTPWCLDMKADNPTKELWIPPRGRILWPGELYLGSTVEWTETNEHAPMIEGRSSVARLGMCVHLTAGFGDVSFKGTWTLELTTVYPIRVFAGVPIAQIAYTTIIGERQNYNGRYQGQTDPVASRLWQDSKK
jgi:dCTP deaminase